MAKVWFITGASRGLGVEFAKAAMRAGDRVVATGRKASAVNDALGPNNAQLLAIDLDVTHRAQVRRAVDTAVSKLGTIDVLVNNAGYGHLGFFEEATDADVRAQFETNFFGALDVTRAVLPVMRAARKGRIFNLSSLAGIRGVEFASLYNASKFALEGFSEALAAEVAPFGIFVTLIEPGPFRTDFLSRESLRFGGNAIPDYDERRARVQATFEDRSGKQPGDPVKLAEAVVRLANEEKPPMRFIAGAFAVATAEKKLADMKAELDQWREASIATDY
ncbi:MAG TPA: oxidoreductase [Steroidobacteraceae bacterium]|jgi:NAD(P)-dependent dehydrogenase (short-subunit alcohol dehydrogenase family)|nr:oxidoreductase [Steroidobacteraceae bacterium]